MSGTLIVLDGLDGSGKSTQFDLLTQNFRQEGKAVCPISFPDYNEPSSALVKMYLGGEFGTDPNAVNPFAASSFYAVDRYASYKRFWEARYTAGEFILAARYTTSNAIHQMPKLPKSEWDNYLYWLEDYEYRLLKLPKPDLVIFLDMPPEVSQKLLMNRYDNDSSKRDIHERNVTYLLECREAALYAGKKLGWTILDCAQNGEARSIDSIQQELIKLTDRM